MKQSPMMANTVDELIALARLPMVAYPTILSAMRNIQLPLDADDHAWLTGANLQVFSMLESSPSGIRKMTRSNLSPQTFTPDDPVIVTGVCVFLYTEPMATVIEGNSFGPQSSITETPASPINLRKDDAFLDALFAGGAAPGDLEACAAQLDHGGPTWRFAWAALHALRLQFECPNSSYETLMNERLIDIGNSCARVDFSGLSDARTPHISLVRKINARLAALQGRMPPNQANPGFFVPINSEQLDDGDIVPERYTATEAAYGQPDALPAIETWFRLPFPMPMDTTTKIKMYMEPSAGDEDYLVRMIEEGSMLQCAGPIPGVASTFPLREGIDTNTGDAAFTQIPSGMIRFGLGFKGFQVREAVCHQWRRAVQDTSFVSQIMSGSYSPDFSGMCGGPGGLGAPGDVADKMIDDYFQARGEAGGVVGDK